MTSEQRLSAALRTLDDYAPSNDLWSRVLYSIEEDEAHRRRLRTTGVYIVSTLLVATVVAWLSTSPSGLNGRSAIDWRVLEVVETVLLVALILTLGPAIRRFGRGYVDELLVTSPETGTRLLRLLDIAYYLVFVGYVLSSVRLEPPVSFVFGRIGDQVHEVLVRSGGLILSMGLLHAMTFMALPLIALVFNSTRAGTKLPRWVNLIAAAGAIVAGLVVLVIMAGAAGG